MTLGLEGFQIRLYVDSDGNGLLSQAEYDAGPFNTTTTDANGDFSFSSVAPNTYIMVNVLPSSSWLQTAARFQCAGPRRCHHSGNLGGFRICRNGILPPARSRD